MNKLILCGLCILVVMGLSEARRRECPLTACPAIEYPPECKAESYLIYRGQACQQCDKCIENPIEYKGCPVMPCHLMSLPPKCRGRSYFIWKGRLCEDCDVDLCNLKSS